MFCNEIKKENEEVILKKWEDLPQYMKNDAVKEYYDILKEKQASLLLKRLFDIVMASAILIILLPIFITLSIAIKIDSKGPIMFRQVRVTQYGKKFRIFKFRTMVNKADKMGSQITTENDARITRIGKKIRKYRLDEIPQLINIIMGDMTFVGTRPEVVKYVEKYTDEMMSTLLLPAGVTSKASIEYRNEAKLLQSAKDVDRAYIAEVLPAKMKYNLESINEYSFLKEIIIMIKTIGAIF